MIILIILSTAIEAAGSKKVNPTELYEKAEKYLYIGDYNEALKVLKKYVRAEKKDPDGWSMYAFAHRKLEKYKQADRYYKKALVAHTSGSVVCLKCREILGCCGDW